MTVGEVFLSAFLQVLFDRLASREVLAFATGLKIDAELKKLALLVSKINAVLEDAEVKQVKDMAIKLWIDELQDVVDDAEDALDEFSTEILKCNLEAQRNNVFSPLNPVGAVFFNMQVDSKIKAITKRLEGIAKQTVELGLREDVGEKSFRFWQRLPTTSLVDDRIYGREEDAKNLTEFLLRDAGEGLCVIPLVGLGGIGKTTLTRIAYNDNQVDQHFDLKAWAFVSGDFDLVTVTKAILESLGESCDATNLEPLQSTLGKKLMMKKVLLVLDDFWNENYIEWDVLQLPFRASALGSKIIVTTRNENVAQMVGTGPVFHLQQLPEDDCWSLLAEHAFSGFNSEARPNLESIGKGIAKKCKGLPLAAKALGGLLRSKLRVDEWQHILHSDVWELPAQKCGILPGLGLSYYHLPSHLKPCFAYCAIFPKGYEFDEEQLVRLWIAEGLVPQPQRYMQIEDVGSQYFHDLLSRSLFQRCNGNISRFMMHDLINDLAQFAAGDKCLRLEDINRDKNWKKARHFSYIRQKRDAFIRFKDFTSSHKCLRTFLPLDGGYGICRITNKVMHQLLKSFSRLHVLSLSHYEITELPELIGELKHLRYLDLSNTSIKVLPESICTLYNLQTLNLYGCHYLIRLPTDMWWKLVNLKILDIRESNLQQLPPHMGRLKNLRILPYFLASRDTGISELKDLSNLKGDLHILGMEHVADDKNAVEANLMDKKYLDKLVLEWRRGSDGMLDDDVLDALQPHRNLRELTIKHYSGTKFPNWIADPSFSNLAIISLGNSSYCKHLPPLGQLPSLKNLIVEGMDTVCSVGLEFYGGGRSFSVKPFQSLEILKFKNMPLWEEWFPFGVAEFPLLYELCIENCPRLEKIPGYLASLKTLEIRNCKKLSCIPCLPHIQNLVLEECDQVIMNSVADLASLEKLRLDKILNLKCIPSEFFNSFTALCDLQVANCDELMVLSDQFGLAHHACLRRLTISKCSFRFLWPEKEEALPHLLECLEISYCYNLVQIPPGILSLKSFKTLNINNCPKLSSLPEMNSPSNLRHLEIKECQALPFLPDGLMRNENLSLEFLVIDGCLSLESFPDGDLPVTLHHLQISNCPKLNVLPTSNSSASSSNSSSLKVLEVCDCIMLSSLPDHLYNFIHLDKLLISNCLRLVSFPDGGLPPNLMSLSISDCHNLRELPDRLYNITSLQELTIRDCNSLRSYPEGGLPTDLRLLNVIGCNLLEPPSRWDLYKLSSLGDYLITNDRHRLSSCPSHI